MGSIEAREEEQAFWPGKTKNSKDLVVILNFLRVFTVSLRCTVLPVFVLRASAVCGLKPVLCI